VPVRKVEQEIQSFSGNRLIDASTYEFPGIFFVERRYIQPINPSKKAILAFKDIIITERRAMKRKKYVLWLEKMFSKIQALAILDPL